MTDLRVGQYVRKAHGYKFPGVVVAVVFTTAGQVRYVVECTALDCAGMLHIFSSDQLSVHGQ